MSKRFWMSAVTGIVLLLIANLASTCAPVMEAEPAIDTEIDESNNGQQIGLLLGQTLTVTLRSNPSTGFKWEIVDLDESILQQIGMADFESSVPDNPPPGTDGWTIFQFEAQGTGKSNLRLIYHRPWTDERPDSVYTVQVVVR